MFPVLRQKVDDGRYAGELSSGLSRFIPLRVASQFKIAVEVPGTFT